MTQPTIEQVAAMAWDVSKEPADPPFHLCQVDHRERLVYLAQNVAQSGVAESPFEQQVKATLRNPDETLAELRAKYEPVAEPEVVEPEPVAEVPVKATKKKGK